MKRFWSVLVVLFVFIPAAVDARVFVSEVAWAGSSVSTADEWFELYNDGGAAIPIGGWRVEGAGTGGSALLLPDGAEISGGGTYLIANYGADDPKTTLAAAPDFVTTSVALSNSDLWLRLIDGSGAIVDAVGSASAPPAAGTSGATKASMERVGETWATATASVGFDSGAVEMGTPGIYPTAEVDPDVHRDDTDAGAETVSEVGTSTSSVMPPSSSDITPPPPVIPADAGISVDAEVDPDVHRDDAAAETAATSTATTTAVVSTKSKLVPRNSGLKISELYPMPNSGEEEFVELTNESSSGELLDGWTLTDGGGAVTPLGGLIMPWSRAVMNSPKGRLNDAGDMILLKDPDGFVRDAISYGDFDAGPYRKVDGPKRGESAVRVELKDEWTVTAAVTAGAANVVTVAETQNPKPPNPKQITNDEISKTAELPTVTVGAPSTLVIPAKAGTSALGHVDPDVHRDDTGGSKKSVSMPKPAPKSRYKGRAYEAEIAVPPGLYGKTRMLVLTEGNLRFLKLSRASTAAYETGERVSFIAQEKNDEGGSYLAANVKTLASLDEVEERDFAETVVWPETASPVTLTGTVTSLDKKELKIRVGDKDGVIVLPAAFAKPALRESDEISVRGFVSPEETPKMYVSGENSLVLIKSYVSEASAKPAKPLKLPTGFAVAATAFVILGGLLAYLRNERLKRMALARPPIRYEDNENAPSSEEA